MKTRTPLLPVPQTSMVGGRSPTASGRVRAVARWLTAVLAVTGCSSSDGPASESEAAAEDDSIPVVPVPPADGPKLVVLEHMTVVRDRPSSSGEPLGYLRAGAFVVRATEPYSKKGCEGGWYPIRPRGFVCAGDGATTELSHPLAKLPVAAPRMDLALPYRYARVRRGEGVVYAQVPTRDEQLAAEPKLSGREKPEPSALGSGASDVPFDDLGIPSGPPVLLPGVDGAGADGRRTTTSFFALPGWDGAASTLTDGSRLAGGGDLPATQVLKRRSIVAVTGGFATGEGANERRFAVLGDGRLLPEDRLHPALGTSWHGIDLREVGLPVAFAVRTGARNWLLGDGGKVEIGEEEFAEREAIPLTGRFRTVHDNRYYFTNDDQWVRARDLIVVLKRDKFPDFASGDQKWLDISLANQTLVAWEGRRPLFATLVSSGQDRLGDPQSAPATAQGVFKITAKYVSRAVDDREVGQTFSLLDVPWVADFADGTSLVGAVWKNSFGEADGFHSLALAPADARFVWTWSDPPIPEGWHGVVAGEDDAATIVYTHR